MLSVLSVLIEKGNFEKVNNIIKNYPEMVSTQVSTTGERSKVFGTVVHIAKGKKLLMSVKIAEKKFKKEGSYFRMVFCRSVQT